MGGAHPWNNFPMGRQKNVYLFCVMLGRGCLRAFLENILFPLKVNLRWVCVNLLRCVQKWVKGGFLGAILGQNVSKLRNLEKGALEKGYLYKIVRS